MIEFHGIIHLLVSLLLATPHVSGDQRVPTPKKPKLFCYGWPTITSVTVSMETIPVEGIIQYDLLYNRTCLFGCPSAAGLSLVDGCQLVENQSLTSECNLASKVLTCTICNSSKQCLHMGIINDNFHDLCLYLRVNTSFGSSHICTERRLFDLICFPPPKAMQLLATAKKQLTVLWEHPDGIEPSMINYKVILQDHLGQCTIAKKESPKIGDLNSHNFTGLSPWLNYSVAICSGLYPASIPVNNTVCTCGDDYHLPGGPVVTHTLPEEPSEHPLLEPCEALCDDTNFIATLKWKASNSLIWNGIPTKSVVSIWNSSSPVPDKEGNVIAAPSATFPVLLEPNYNGSLLMLTVNLSSHLNYSAKVQFCSNGGCGPGLFTTLSCDICESLKAPGTVFTGDHPKNAAEYSLLAIGAGVFIIFIIVGTVVTLIFNKKKRPRNYHPQSLQEAIGELPPPPIYEDPDSTDVTSDDVPYCQVYSSESQLLINDGQKAQWV